MSKQDSTFTRTASALEQKYSFGKKFSEILGLIDDTRDRVDSTESSLHSEIKEQYTSIMRDTEKYVSEALVSYVTKDGLESSEETLKSEFQQTASDITMNFYKDTIEKQISDVDGELKTIVENLQKHFVFGVDGLTIKAGAGAMELVLDNDIIKFMKNGKQFGWWDGVNFHTGNIFVDVDEVAQFGNYGFVPFEEGDVDGLDLVRVGGS